MDPAENGIEGLIRAGLGSSEAFVCVCVSVCLSILTRWINDYIIYIAPL